MDSWSLDSCAPSQCGSVLGVRTSAAVTSEQIRQTSVATERDHEQRRKGATLEFVTATLDRVGDLRRQGLPELTHGAVGSWIDNPKDFGDERNEVTRDYLNGYEAFATGVNLGLYDLGVVHALRGGNVIASWTLFQPWVVARRELIDRPTLYTELEKLAGDLESFRRSQGLPPVSIR